MSDERTHLTDSNSSAWRQKKNAPTYLAFQDGQIPHPGEFSVCVNYEGLLRSVCGSGERGSGWKHVDRYRTPNWDVSSLKDLGDA